IKLTGVDPSWAAALGTIAMHESGGNPSVDQGGLSGYAQAHGVMQMIQATFAANALPGHTDIYNPVDNIASAIEYIKQRYGNPNNTPGIRSINSGGSYQGYATGGIALTPQLAALAENGPEAVLPLTGARGGELSDQTDLLQEAVDILKQIAAPNPKVPSSFSARMRHA
ncbi:MAG: transglycosylase SLT domain-containing protein, partial [Acidimicrobiaceae bacterium]|nr:transglycosylase SLT domain-containing protein [Acidimicrobiaceae bacterium]